MLQFDAKMVTSTAASGLYAQALVPVIPTWYRLEASPVADGYDEGLAARVADPLWMLGRQWQFREFDGEDAGSPLMVDYRFEGAQVLAYAAGADPKPEAFGPLGARPLEAQVEAEPVWGADTPHRRAMAEAGRMFTRLAGDDGQAALADQVFAAYPLALPAPPDPLSDSAGMLWHLLLDKRCIHAAELATDLRAQLDGAGQLAALPPKLVAGGVGAGALPLLSRWLAWVDDFIVEGDGAAWRPDHLEYSFELAAGRAPAERWRLDAQQYTDGRIDWHDFDLRPAANQPLLPNSVGTLDDARDRRSFATPVVYPGMPATRFWAFEDANVNFARIDAAKLDLVRMVVAEYALVHGNDWFLVPAQLPTGGLYRVSKLQVIDTFGVVTTVEPVVADAGITWRLQGLSQPDDQANNQGNDLADGHWLFLPPALSDTLEGEPLEQVAFARDEMANLVWAIEKRVQGSSGEPIDRALEDQRYAIAQQPALSLAKAPLMYRLMTAVPSHWIPMLPSRDAGDLSLDIHLLRGAMKRFYRQDAEALAATPGLDEFLQRLRDSAEFVEPLNAADPGRALDLAIFAFHPRGHLLRTNPAVLPGAELPLRVAEEELGREGVVVERRFQMARTPDGRSWLWVGRRKRVGRGEANSGLRFDQGVLPGTR